MTGQQLAAVNIGRIVPGSGNLTNGIGQSGDAGTPDRLIEDNGILFAPRFGLTYDITGDQSFIFRAGGGIFYDRYEGNISFALISNPPTTSTPRIDFGRLQEIDPATRCWRRRTSTPRRPRVRCRRPTTSTPASRRSCRAA